MYCTNSYQNVSFDLTVLFRDTDNFTASDACNQYFGTKDMSIDTLQSIDSIFSRILISYQNKSMITIQTNPQTQFSNNISFINCSTYDNFITLTTYFMIQTIDNNTQIIDSFFIESYTLLIEYFGETIIVLSFHHKIITINNTIQITKYNLMYLLFLLIIPVILIIICGYTIRKHTNSVNENEMRTFNENEMKTVNENVTMINQTLVLIIAISEFDDQTLTLDGVKTSVKHLTDLWKDIYNYSVFICNQDTLKCTKSDITDFMDKHLHHLSKEIQCVIIHVISHTSKDNAFISSDMEQIPLQDIRRELSVIDTFYKRSFLKIIFDHSCKGDADYFMHSNANNDIEEKMASQIQMTINIGNQSGSLEEIPENVDKSTPPPNIVKSTPSGTLTSRTNSDKVIFEDGKQELVRIESYGALEDINFVVVSGTIHGRAMSDSSIFSECIYNVFGQNANRIMKHGFIQLLTQVGKQLGDRTNSAEICSFTSTMRHEQVLFEKCT